MNLIKPPLKVIRLTLSRVMNYEIDLRMKIFNPILMNQIGERLCPYCRAFALDHRA